MAGGTGVRQRTSTRRGRLATAAAVAALALALAAGCAGPVRFPETPLAATPSDAGILRTYDTDADGQANYFTTENADGRIVRIGYDTARDGRPDSFVNLDDIAAADCRHVVIILDGIGYETVRAYQEGGGLRLFHPPAPVVSTFPAMTDIALADVFQSTRCYGMEAVYFDHATNRLMGGDGDYLSMKNESWARHTDYRAATIVDPLAYLFPDHYFKQELADVRALFERRDRSLLVAYLVSTAGLGTKDMADGQRRVLDAIDRLAGELVWRTRGLVKLTLLSDHGHALVRCQWVDFRKFLAEKGWNVRDRLDGPRDVVPIEYGLVTYASYATRDRAGLAATLVEHEGVDVVAWVEGDAVAVASADGKALIERRGSRYRYRAASGDPLRLKSIVEQATSAGNVFDADGFADDRAWLRLTSAHDYPDALDRLWRAFHGQTENVPDVLASLKLGYDAGLASRAWRFPDGASTHGDLTRRGSLAFIMSTTRPIAPEWGPLRARDLAGILDDLTGRPWPPPRKDQP